MTRHSVLCALGGLVLPVALVLATYGLSEATVILVNDLLGQGARAVGLY